MEKKTRTLFIGSVIAFASLLCVFIIGFSSYVILQDVESKSSNVSVQIEETNTADISITGVSATGDVIFGPAAGNTEGTLKDDGVEGEQESLSVTITIEGTATTSFNGYVSFSIEPEDTESTAYSNIYANYVYNGNLLDPIAGATSSNVGNTIDVVSFNSGAVAAIDHTLVSPEGKLGVITSVSSTTSSDTIAFSATLTVTYGWGTYFTYMNPAEADDDGVTPNNSVTDMKSVLDAMYSAFYDETSGSSSLPLGAVVSGRIDDDAVSTMVAEYDFTLWTGNGAASSVTQTLIDTAYTGGIFSSESSDLPTFAKTTADGTSNSYVYKGNSTTGGAFQIDSTDPSFLRLGTGSAIGAVTFSFTEGTNVKRAVLSAHSWTAGTTTGTGNVTYFSVNDSTGQLASRDYVAAPLTFDFTASDSVTIATTTSGTRGFIFTLAFYN